MTQSGAQEKPSWLRVKIPSLGRLETMRLELRTNRVATVCDSSRCPNLGECWGRGEATFMILGKVCTRSCHFCAVGHGTPSPVDPGEPKRVAEAASSLALRHAVITSVTRDDLLDSGAEAFAAVVKEMRAKLPCTRVELLIPDMKSERRNLETVARCGADVIGHNVEVVESLQDVARDPSASYDRSLDVLRFLAHEDIPAVKSSLMLGLGEEEAEVRQALRDMKDVGVSMVTIGQYLRPNSGCLPVVRYVEPAEFEDYATHARSIGFRAVLSGPLVRSSYHASEAFDRLASGG